MHHIHALSMDHWWDVAGQCTQRTHNHTWLSKPLGTSQYLRLIFWAASVRSNVMESPATQLPEGTSHIPSHRSQRGVAAADSSLAAHCSCTPCSAPRTLYLSSQTNPTLNLCLGSSIFRQAGALQNQMGTNRQIFMGLSRCRRGKLKFSVQVVYTRLT